MYFGCENLPGETSPNHATSHPLIRVFVYLSLLADHEYRNFKAQIRDRKRCGIETFDL